jgi:hypothetical protein
MKSSILRKRNIVVSSITTLLALVYLLNAINFAYVDGQPLVDTRNIANNAVTSPKIEDGQVKTQDIDNNAITTSKISNGAVETNDLADNSVTSNKIVDGSITSADLASNVVVQGTERLSGATNVIFSTCSIDFSSVHAHQLVFAFCPVPGVSVGDKVIVTNQDISMNLLTQSASVNSTGTIKIAVMNPNSYAGDPTRITWAVIVFRI